jgi:hypothetical protein
VRWGYELALLPIRSENAGDEYKHICLEDVMDEQPDAKLSNEQESTTREPEKPVRNVIGYSLLFMFLGLAFLFFACTRYYIEVPEGFAHEIAKAAAHITWIGIAFYFLKRITKNRGKPTFHGKTGMKGTTFFYISIIFCILTTYQSLSLLIEVSSTKKTLSKVVSIYNDIYEGKQISKVETNGREQYGEMTPLMSIMTEVGSAIQKDCSVMNDEIQECHLESIFKPETLTQPILLSETLSNCEKAGSILDKYEKQIRFRYDECSTKIRDSLLPENIKNRALSSVNKENDQSLKNILNLFEIRRKFVAEAKNLLTYVKSRPNSFKYQNNKMIVEAEEDANFCRASFRNLMSLSQEEDDWMKKTKQEVSTKLKQVNELVK